MATVSWKIQMYAVPSHLIPWDLPKGIHGNDTPMDKTAFLHSEAEGRAVKQAFQRTQSKLKLC